MTRGGNRPGAGRKYKWISGETRTIRVPVILADKLLQIARLLDSGTIKFDQGVLTENNVSKTLRVATEVKVYQDNGEEMIKLSDFKRLMQALAKADK